MCNRILLNMKPDAYSSCGTIRELTRFQELEGKLTLAPAIRQWEQRLTVHYNAYERAVAIKKATDQQLRLMAGELSAQEICAIRAILNHIIP